MRKSLLLLLVLALLLSVAWALGEESSLLLDAPTELIRPGKAVQIGFGVPETCEVTILLTDDSGQRVSTIVENLTVTAGNSVIWWNGSYNSLFAPAGDFLLTLRALGQEISAPVRVGLAAPYIGNIFQQVDPDARRMEVDFYASVDGLLTVGVWSDGVWSLLSSQQVSAGENAYVWHYAGATDDTTALTLTLTDMTGFSSNEEHVTIDAAQLRLPPAPTPSPTPVPTQTPVPTATLTPAPAEPPMATLPGLEPVDPAATEKSAETPVETPTEAPADNVLDIPLEIPMEVPMEDGAGAPADTLGETLLTETVFTPALGSPYEGQDTTMNYWTLPMDITDEEAVWAMLMQPMTVVSGDNRSQVSLYAEPDENSQRVAVVTCASQGVHVLETLDNGWSLVECYSSSFHDSKVKAWNMLVQGYIKTSKLTTVEPQQSYGIVVDKLTQRLYLFKDGKLFSTLLISTGIANERQPYNETRSGEFFIISPTGGFWSDNLYCPRALRFNDGDLLHEVPYVSRGSSKIYSTTEPYLGEKASHGCIRVQRKKTPEGVNMQWIWDNRKMKTKIVIWEDWQGRQIDIPEDDFQLYYNPSGGEYYHSQETCYSYQSNKKTMTAFSYGELETGDFAKLERCEYCAPVERRSVLEEINALYAPGGDHDPVMTEARQKYLNGEYDE